MIAYCGLVCTDCPAYVATQADDLSELERVAAQWREEFHFAEITAESVVCDGCVADSGRHCSHCVVCEVRICGAERGVVNCGHCEEYVCDKMERFFGFAPGAREVLDGVRAGL